jgi:hypothetical protein
LNGLLIAVLVTIVSLNDRANSHPIHVLGRKPGTKIFRPMCPEHPKDETFLGLLLLRPDEAGGMGLGEFALPVHDLPENMGGTHHSELSAARCRYVPFREMAEM